MNCGARILLAGILASVLWCGSPRLASAQQGNADAAQLLEIGAATRREAKSRAAKSESSATSPRIKFVSYNIRWRGGKELARLIETLQQDKEVGDADLLALQEVDRNKQRTNGINTARQIAAALGMAYAWAAPPAPLRPGNDEEREEQTGVLLLSRYPFADVTRIVLPQPGVRGRRRVALGATVMPEHGRTLRFYSVHAETRIENRARLEQFQAVLDDADRFPAIKNIIIAGDLNTASRASVTDTGKLFRRAGYATPFDDEDATWRTFILMLKLDWIWLRGVTPVKFGIDKGVGFSDHYPLWLEARLGD